MNAKASAGRRGVLAPAGAEAALLEGLLATTASAPPWAAAARLAPLRSPASACRAASRSGARRTSRLLGGAAVVLLAGGIAMASVRATPVRAAREGVAPTLAAALVPAVHTLAEQAAADQALLASLLAAPTAEDAAMLESIVARPPVAPVAFPAFELAEAPAAARPEPVSFTTVNRLPDAAFAYTPVTMSLPAITLADQIIPPPPPPAPPAAPVPQPPPPPGYVQPPGYQDGVPFGGQIGAVPPAGPGRPAGGAVARPARPVAAVYVVRSGDTLSSISLRFYGAARFAPVIWDANYHVIGANPNLLRPGQRLVLPRIAASPTAPARLPARGPIARHSFYTIQPHDYLRWIAVRAYGNELLWPRIFNANRNVLGPDPDLIYPGVRIYIP
ncbi:MAG: LysM peptidoglycan-binding domain-containing protein [Oscillochloridaceae bacterium]|nr:LysM peptidoglycan-binding domain-containing protein [Chloroflexaceae bacterium]MDW8391631.1 LysM peptidoglycan-binding domain-containing protein [Oscillochloridaceae bacterium]